MKRHIIILTIMMTFFSTVICAQMQMGGMGGAGSGGHSRGGDRGNQTQSHAPSVNTDNIRNLLSFGDEIGLSEKQVTDIKEIRENFIRETKKMYESVEKSQLEFSEMLNQNMPDFSEARSKIKEITEIIANIQTASVDAYEKAFNVLSDEQKQKIVVIRQALKEKNQSEEKAVPTESPSTDSENKFK